MGIMYGFLADVNECDDILQCGGFPQGVCVNSPAGSYTCYCMPPNILVDGTCAEPQVGQCVVIINTISRRVCCVVCCVLCDVVRWEHWSR